MTPHVLAIDLGTSGPKVALVGLDGRIAAAHAGSVGLLCDGPRAEQDPEEIWRAVVAAVRRVLATAALPAAEIVAVTCASQYFSLVPVDHDARPIGPLVLWLDRRGARHNHALYARHPEAFAAWAEVHGMVPLPSGNDSLAHLLYFQNEAPEIYERAARFLEPMDYVLARLCATHAANPCSAFAQLLTDNRDPTRPRYDDGLIAMAGVDRDKLPALVPIGTRLGSVRPELAGDFGIGAQTPVFAGINDTQAAAIGTATFRPHYGALNVGTTAQVLAHVPGKRSDFEHEIVSMPSPIAGRHMAMAENGLGAKPLDHMLHNVTFTADALADHRSDQPFAGIEALLRDVPPGSGNVLFLPWLTGSGAPSGSQRARGGFINISLETSRAHMIRAVLEGCALNLRWLLPAVEHFAEDRFTTLRFSGGASVSDGWAQIMADATGRTVEQVADGRHVNNRATALLAFRELGMCDLDAVERICPTRQAYEPRAEHRETYDRLFEQFVACFEQLRPIFNALNPSA